MTVAYSPPVPPYRLHVLVELAIEPIWVRVEAKTAAEIVREFNARSGQWRRVWYGPQLLVDSKAEGRDRIGRSTLYLRMRAEEHAV